jgi:hypothetical protein
MIIVIVIIVIMMIVIVIIVIMMIVIVMIVIMMIVILLGVTFLSAILLRIMVLLERQLSKIKQKKHTTLFKEESSSMVYLKCSTT